MIPTCHPDRKHHAKGLCALCYAAECRAKETERDRKKIAKKNRAWYKKHRKIVLAQKKKVPQNYNITPTQRCRAWKKKAYERLGNRCKRCGFDDLRALQIDHILGTGAKDRKTRNRNHVVLYKLIATMENAEEVFQILCANCNWIKRCERGEVNQWAKEPKKEQP